MLGALVLALAPTGCRTATDRGAVTGGLIGAGAGLLAADALDESSGAGALIGAGVGSLIGALHGLSVDLASPPSCGVVWDGPAVRTIVVRRPARIVIVE